MSARTLPIRTGRRLVRELPRQSTHAAPERALQPATCELRRLPAAGSGRLRRWLLPVLTGLMLAFFAGDALAQALDALDARRYGRSGEPGRALPERAWWRQVLRLAGRLRPPAQPGPG